METEPEMEIEKRKLADRLPFLWIIGIEKWTPPFLQSVALRCWKPKISLQQQRPLFPFTLSPILSRLWRTTTPCLSLFWQRARKHKICQRLALCYGPRMYIFLIRNYYVDLCSQAENEKVQTGHPPPITVTLLTATLRADVCTHWKALEYVKMFE